MRIERLSIDSFGHFSAAEFGPFQGRIVVIQGPNGSGKSTLLAFIQAVLFGFPYRNETVYLPALNGAKRGGRLVLVDGSGDRFTIERTDGTHRGPVTVTSSDGRELGADYLRTLLGNTSRDIFENVFAFGLDQLTSIDSLSDQDISNQIYGAGLGAQKLPSALSELEKQAAEIFLPRGTTQPVYHLLSRLDDIDRQLQEQPDDSREYSRLLSDLERFASRSQQLRDAYLRLRAERDEIDAVLDARKAAQQTYEQLAAHKRQVPQVDDDRVTARRQSISEIERSNAQLTVLRQQLDDEERRLAETGTTARSPFVPLGMLLAAGIAVVAGTVAGGVALLVSIVVAVLLATVAMLLFLGQQRRTSNQVTQLRRVDHARATWLAERERLASLLRQAGFTETTGVAQALSAIRREMETIGDSRRSHADRLAWLENQLAEHESAFQKARSELTAETGTDLESRVAQIDTELDRTDDLRVEQDQLIGETRAAIRRLEAGTSATAQLRAQQEQTLEQLRVAAGEWSGYMLAHEILTRSRKRFEEEHQPAVIQTARRYLSTITDGAYDRIVVSNDGKQIQVVQPNGARKQDNELSRGTREQLYLALRFGYITELGRTSASLPVIVDDILVNFDPARARATAHAFAELSATNQILVFTCHPSTVDHFRAASPDVEVVELGDAVPASRV